jgi:hypothetical protein
MVTLKPTSSQYGISLLKSSTPTFTPQFPQPITTFPVISDASSIVKFQSLINSPFPVMSAVSVIIKLQLLTNLPSKTRLPLIVNSFPLSIVKVALSSKIKV